ncbi:uncharacterized protein si:dkeyp-84f3.9 isoform X2 [Hoplias malabaricus]|uniref:uncharacterized protein si:dkeyp-84f3.9 isoform X2 n=1 Tax=Hoplias malabaricus TaxID=27720 RepID=UPI003461DAF2
MIPRTFSLVDKTSSSVVHSHKDISYQPREKIKDWAASSQKGFGHQSTCFSPDEEALSGTSSEKSRSQSLKKKRRGRESMLLEVQCKVSIVSDDLGCHVICWCWSTVFSEVQGQRSRLPGSFRALHASCC